MTVAVYDVDWPVLQCFPDPASVPFQRALTVILGKFPRKRRRGEQLAFGLRALAGDDERLVARRHELPIQHRQDLLGAAGGVAADWRKDIGNAEDRQSHPDPLSKPNEPRAARAWRRHSAPVIFHPSLS